MDDTQQAEPTEESKNSDEPAAPETPDPLARLTDAVTALAGEVRAHHTRAAAREKVIDHLHAEVERLRAGTEAIILRPVVADLQNLRGDLLRQIRTLPEQVTHEQVETLLRTFALSVELTLERCGSVPLRPEPGAPFTPREHRAVKVLVAPSEDRDATIAEVVADGYRDTRTDRVITPARVHVWRWQPLNHTPDSELEGTRNE